MKNHDEVLRFYMLLMLIINHDDQEFPDDVAKEALEQYEIVKDSVSVPEFSLEKAKILHSDFGVREDYTEAAFRDLAVQIRHPKVRDLIEGFLSRSGTADDFYLHVKNVRLLKKDDSNGAAVVTLVVHSYDIFKDFISKDSGVEFVHASFSKDASAD